MVDLFIMHIYIYISIDMVAVGSLYMIDGM